MANWPKKSGLLLCPGCLKWRRSLVGADALFGPVGWELTCGRCYEQLDVAFRPFEMVKPRDAVALPHPDCCTSRGCGDVNAAYWAQRARLVNANYYRATYLCDKGHSWTTTWSVVRRITSDEWNFWDGDSLRWRDDHPLYHPNTKLEHWTLGELLIRKPTLTLL